MVVAERQEGVAEAAAEPALAEEGVDPDLLAEAEAEPRKPGAKRGLLIAVLLVLLLAGGGAAYYFMFMPSGEDEVAATSPTGTAAVDELAAIRARQVAGADAEVVATALGEYAASRDLGQLGDAFWELAGPLIDADLATARSEAQTAQLAAWQAEHEKLVATAVERREEAERQAAAAAKQQAEEAARKAEAGRQAEEAAELAAKQDDVRWKSVEKCRTNDYAAAASLFAPFVSDERPEVVVWAKDKVKCIELAGELYERIYNTKKKLAGAQLPVPQSRKKWTVTFIGPKSIEAEMTTTVYEKGVGRQETKQFSLPLDEADEQIFFLLTSHLATVDKTLDAGQLQLEFGAFLVSRARYLGDALKRLAALPGTEAMRAEIEILGKKADQ